MPGMAEQLRALAEMKDRDVDTSDIPEIVDWRGGAVGKFYRPLKTSVTIRLDADVVAWFKARGGKYQSAVNQVLRDYVVSRAKRSARR